MGAVTGGATVVVFAEEPGAEEVPFEADFGVAVTVLEEAVEEDGVGFLFPSTLQAVEGWPATLAVTWKTPEQA